MNKDDPLHPDNPAQVRRRKKANILFAVTLVGVLALMGGATYSLVERGTLPDGIDDLLWPLLSAAAAALGIYTWAGIERNR